MNQSRTGRVGIVGVSVVGVLLMSPWIANAQQSGIAGVVRDTSGGVLPGVTVEAASPALIEKVRAVVVDGEGRYNVVDLRPGTYTVTFTLPGFSTYKREGIVLTAGFTATVDAEMQVGSLEETITVAGEAPLVDTRNVSQQKVVSSELLSVLPSSVKGAASSLIAVVPGMVGSSDVGGSSGIYRSNGQSGGMFYHGKSDIVVLNDGLGISAATPGTIYYVQNSAFGSESAVETGSGSGASTAPIVTNLIPLEGGNRFAFQASGMGSNQHLQSGNLTDALRARGVTSENKALLFYDLNATLGGPIRQDRLWFFVGTRVTRVKNSVAGLYFNKTIGTPFYTRDLDRPAYRTEWLRSGGARVTWQASEKNKIGGFADVQRMYNRGRGEYLSPESYTNVFDFKPQGLFQLTWSSPKSNKFLLEAGSSFAMGNVPYASPGDGEFAAPPDAIAITELSTNFTYNAKAQYNQIARGDRAAGRFTASYVTGSHAFRAGVQVEEGISDRYQIVHHDVNYAFNRGVPTRITQYATPWLQKTRARDLGLFVQDQWTVKRLTLNYGLRFDALNGWVPPPPFARRPIRAV